MITWPLYSKIPDVRQAPTWIAFPNLELHALRPLEPQQSVVISCQAAKPVTCSSYLPISELLDTLDILKTEFTMDLCKYNRSNIWNCFEGTQWQVSYAPYFKNTVVLR
jgi:hypothetical protein